MKINLLVTEITQFIFELSQHNKFQKDEQLKNILHVIKKKNPNM